jgi:hypothetical protein
MDLDAEVAAFTRDFGVPDCGPIDETSLDLDPSDEPPAPRKTRSVRYSERFGQQVRELGGIQSEATLIVHCRETP